MLLHERCAPVDGQKCVAARSSDYRSDNALVCPPYTSNWRAWLQHPLVKGLRQALLGKGAPARPAGGACGPKQKQTESTLICARPVTHEYPCVTGRGHIENYECWCHRLVVTATHLFVRW
eukprot:SAG25_NODE_481_length_7507_cov_80.752160_2_plen_120_part_00